jgi:heme O synthase-like polyprenyltransferase
MLPVVKSEKQVVNWIVASSVALFVFSFLPLAIPSLGTFGWIYYALDVAVTIPFVYVDLKMLQKPTQDSGFRAFLLSLPYMFVLFGAIIASVIL